MKAPDTVLLLPSEMAQCLAERVRALRLLEGWTRNTLASRAGVTPASLKRFETTGKASIDLVFKVAYALGRLGDFGPLLDPPPARSVEELESRIRAPVRKRGRI
jgi:transcriptional regulator with XRE-family HTH domain